MPHGRASSEPVLIAAEGAVRVRVPTWSSRPSVSRSARSESSWTLGLPCSTNRTKRSDTPANWARSCCVNRSTARRDRTSAARRSAKDALMGASYRYERSDLCSFKTLQLPRAGLTDSSGTNVPIDSAGPEDVVERPSLDTTCDECHI
ncbi:hypothetical protein ARTSIC4J27_4515 [Pseudarthrobacter siccitolerans]|uniref:Uncharacterized protein n=1 Tax=Pseudarthrobacter siccitolerans TaxID=861266 RepID=A0A024H934_9MICC|nr:hypothetical protein ARTSIC4J27_4515 [Pseudarthrobacter siccitolerans]